MEIGTQENKETGKYGNLENLLKGQYGNWEINNLEFCNLAWEQGNRELGNWGIGEKENRGIGELGIGGVEEKRKKENNRIRKQAIDMESC